MASKLLLESRGPITLDELSQQSERGKKLLDRVRRNMLAPQETKVAPTFSPLRLAGWIGMDSRQIDYRAKKGALPPGDSSGSRRRFSVQDVRVWTRELRPDRQRPTDAEAVTLCVANFKGGVGKTTSAMTLAQGLSLRGHRVLAIDSDPQGSLTTLFGILPGRDVDEDQTLYPLYLGDEESVEYGIRPTYWDGVDLLPAAPTLFGAEFAIPGRGDAFWDILHLGIDRARQAYDVIIIDTPPSLSYLTLNALMASDGVVMPILPSMLDFVSSVQFWDLFFDATRQIGERGRTKSFEFVDVLLSKVDADDTAVGVVREWVIAAFGSMVLPVEIPQTKTGTSSAAEFKSIYDAKPGVAFQRYEQLVDQVEAQLVRTWLRQLNPAPTAPEVQAA